MNKDNYIDRE